MYIVRIAEPRPSQGENRSRQAATCRLRSTAQCEGTAPHEAIRAPIRPASAKKTSPQIVATLDLSKPHELATEKMIRSATTGRWPLWPKAAEAALHAQQEAPRSAGANKPQKAG